MLWICGVDGIFNQQGSILFAIQCECILYG
ncbi:hypothetical protein D046_7589B, partial [Vibrio parahaemolyticus V-223/04]